MPDQTIIDWRPDRSRALPPVPPGGPPTPLARAVWRGVRNRCPGCGKTRIFAGFLRVGGACAMCATPINQVRADDVPPYFTILIVGHIVVPSMLIVDRAFAPPIWLSTLIWIPLTCALTVGLLRPVKGAIIAVMLKLDMIQPEDAA